MLSARTSKARGPAQKLNRRTDLTTAVIATVVTSSLAKRLVAAAREPRHAVGSDAGQSCRIAATLEASVGTSGRDVCGEFTHVSPRRECIPQHGAGAWHHRGLPASICLEDLCLLRTKRLRPSACSAAKFREGSAGRSILGYAAGLVVIAAPPGAGPNPEEETGAPPKRHSATDGPPHRATTHRPAPVAWDFAAASCCKPDHTMRKQSCLRFLF